MRKQLSIVILAVLSALPIHGEERPSNRHIPAIAAVNLPDNKIKCARAAVALDKWQRLLRLQDWNINLVCGESRLPDSPMSIGRSYADVAHREGAVWVYLLAESTALEEIVIHELAHILIAEIDSPGRAEQHAMLIGKLLYNLKGCAE